jgi:putative Mg2+ transporter-C (MgtC) family protein
MNHPITEIDIVIRLCLGFIAGGIIGLERSSRRQVAGLRTHILISLGATCLMLLSIWLPEHFFGRNADPGRIAAQVVSGIGFLGAGAIIRLGNDIKGLTTAASLWLVAAIGLPIGAGMYAAALTAEILAIIAMMLLNKVERKIFPDISRKLLVIYYNHYNEPDTETVREIFNEYKIKNESINVRQRHSSGKKTKVRYLITILDSVDITKLAKAIKSSGDINRVEIKEKFS